MTMQTESETLVQNEIESEAQAQGFIRNPGQSGIPESQDQESTNESGESTRYYNHHIHNIRFDSDEGPDSMRDSSDEEWDAFQSNIEQRYKFSRLAPPSFRHIKKATSLVVDTRTFIHNSNWIMLCKNILCVDRVLIRHPVESKRLALLLPIFARLFDDVDQLVIQQPRLNSKDYYRKLDRDQAKALNILNQKWPKLWSKERHVIFEQTINENSANKPQSIAGIHSHATRAILNFVETALFTSATRLSLSRASLSEFPMALLEIYSIIDWYLGFLPVFSQSGSSDSSKEIRKQKVDSIIQAIKILDLSDNLITFIPSCLPDVLPNLLMLNLSNTQISALPRTCTKWLNLRRIRICRQMILPKISRFDGESSPYSNSSNALPVPSLVENCLKRLKLSITDVQHIFDTSLPGHLTQTLAEGTSCESCQRFLWPSVEPLYQCVDFGSRINVDFYPKTVVCGPSFYCKACFLNHTECKLLDSNCLCEMCVFDRIQRDNPKNYWGCVYSP